MDKVYLRDVAINALLFGGFCVSLHYGKFDFAGVFMGSLVTYDLKNGYHYINAGEDEEADDFVVVSEDEV